MDAHVKQVVVFKHKPHNLLRFAVNFNFFQSRKPPDPVIDMGDIVSGLKIAEQPHGQCSVFLITFFQPVPVESFENLVIRIAKDFQIRIDKPFMDRCRYRVQAYSCLKVMQDGLKAVQLPWII